ncbi:MAG: ATP-binding protein [Symploca sp. SIO1B1]|nr:ATP-binding protein [Symploca sp. SIO1B1]
MTNPNTLDHLSLSLSGVKQVLEQYVEGKPPLPLATILKTEPVALSLLGNKFQLSPFERTILLLCLGLEIEPNFQSLCAKAQGNGNKPYATLGLVLSAFPDADWSVLSLQNPLHYWQLLQTEPGQLLTQAPIKIERRILCYLLHQPALVPQLADLVTPFSSEGITDTLPPSYQAISQQIVDAWSIDSPNQRLPLVYLNGTDGTTNVNVAAAACDRLGFELMVLPAAVLPTNPQDLKQLQRHWEREAILSNSVLLLDNDAASPTDPGRETAIALCLETLNTPVILTSCDRKPLLRRPLLTFDVPTLTHQESTALWRAHLGTTAAEVDGYVDVLASQFQLNPTNIQSVCHQLLIQSSELKAGTSSSPLLPTTSVQEHLWTLCRLQARPNLDELAQRLEATAAWEDLVLPERQRTILADIETHLRQRSRVYQEWGFADKGNRGLGISALFYGESGTGKTMAAEVLARNCQLDLYRIDLSTVVSKYIGETEKNLRRIFDAAEAGGAILLFDEADALFGKRTEVKDSHDRHANIEVSYLLQRMEAYRGLAILTTNLKNSLDSAFLRRLRFLLPFPFPDAEARAQIWMRIFPTQTPQQNLDYQKLGQLKVAGGNIRNIALNAAFLAAAENQPVTMHHILQAAQREYLKLEKLLMNEEIKDWDIT